MSFEKCCPIQNKCNYDIKHSPIPFEINGTELKIFEYLLWYTPNCNSKQSSNTNTNVTLDKTELNTILNALHINYEKDFLQTTSNEIHNTYYLHFFPKACINCNKIILNVSKSVKNDNSSELRALFRHFRNSIAHGYFQVVNSHYIFFDEDPRTNKTTAIIKIRKDDFVNAFNSYFRLDNLHSSRISENGYELEELTEYFFIKLGFKIQKKRDNENTYWDFLIEKVDEKYLVNINCKSFNSQYFDFKEIQNISEKFRQSDYFKKGFKLILFYYQKINNPEHKNYIKNLKKQKILIWSSTYLKRKQTLIYKNFKHF